LLLTALGVLEIITRGSTFSSDIKKRLACAENMRVHKYLLGNSIKMLSLQIIKIKWLNETASTSACTRKELAIINQSGK